MNKRLDLFLSETQNDDFNPTTNKPITTQKPTPPPTSTLTSLKIAMAIVSGPVY